jgi:hypothetical protein
MNTNTATLDTFTGSLANLPFSALTSSRFEAKTTGKFQPISTAQAVTHLQHEGWEVFKTSEAKTRIIERRPYVKHQIQLTHPDIAPVDGLRPVVYLQNANDGTSSFSLFAGLFRFICSNGLVVGSSFISAKVRHIGDLSQVRDDLKEGAFKVSSQFPSIMEKVHLMTEKSLSIEEGFAFRCMAYNLRFPNKDAQKSADNRFAFVGDQVRRIEDSGNDLWKVYNRTQEDLITGGFSTGRRTARGLRSLTRSTIINRQLWTLAEKTLSGDIVQAWEETKKTPSLLLN